MRYKVLLSTDDYSAMKIIPINREKWVGVFTYLDAWKDSVMVTEVPFEMRLTNVDGVISGFRTDDETEDIFDKPVTVEGKIQGDGIRFIVMYPGRYFANDMGGLSVDYNDEYPGCIYTGSWNEVDKKYEGNWEIDIKKARERNPDTKVVYSKGTWEMSRAAV